MFNPLEKQSLYTIVVDYRSNTYIDQVFAKDQMDAQLQWVKKIDLNKMGVSDTKKIRDKLITTATDKDDAPGLLNGLQSAWCATLYEFSDRDDHDEYALVDIIATRIFKKNIEQGVLKFSKNKTLYTIQLDYKGGCYVYQVLADTPVEAKMKWIEECDFNEIEGIPGNIQETKSNLLAHSTDQDFIPNPVDGMYSVWSTFAPFGDEFGRVSIVATQTNVVNLKHDFI